MTTKTEEGPIFFFGSKSPFSHHYVRPFSVRGIDFLHMEGFLMFCKAMLFNDRHLAEKVLLCKVPGAVRSLGNTLGHVNEALWDKECEEYAFSGRKAQFAQNKDMQMHLVSTGKREIVEANPYDRKWGIGMGLDHPELRNRLFWGKNRIGKVLMRTRDHFTL